MEDAFDEVFPLNFGSYEDALTLIGEKSTRIVAEFTVNWEMIKVYCSMLEDGNESHWDEEYAKKQWGGIIAPPGMLLTWPMPMQWHPTKEQIHYFIATTIPLPGSTLINVSTDSEFYKHLYLGDRVSVEDTLLAISEKKTTRLGTGHFLTTRAEFFNQKDELVAVLNNNLFRYDTLEANS
ncbi:MAG: MaoC family dehydratase N-terminal domain-containing protein [Pseudomonadales bacterium]|nr:MaoC family dehydratase N-terminal domain-containing protein [Pseudomonadales bacterium]